MRDLSTSTGASAHTSTEPVSRLDATLLADTRCRETTTDAVLRRDVGRLENPAFPETQSPLPPGSWRRRYLEPVVLGGAVVVAALLFFSLRSDSSADA